MTLLERRRMMLQAPAREVTWNPITKSAYTNWGRQGGNNTTLAGNTFTFNAETGGNWSYYVVPKTLVYRVSAVAGKRVRFRGHVKTTGAVSTSKFFISWMSAGTNNPTYHRADFIDCTVTAGENVDQDFDLFWTIDTSSWTQTHYFGARLYAYSGTSGYKVLVTNPILEIEG